jgi:glycosyltransferase involved in cell wall biosynthesis
VVTEFERALNVLNCMYELILVSNACCDESPIICERLARSSERVFAINTATAGWGRAVRLGLAEARGSVVGYTNSARTTGDQLAALILQSLIHPTYVVKATRVGRYGLRKLGSTLYNWQSRRLFHLTTSDVNGTPKFFPRHFMSLFQLSRDDDLIDLEFLRVCRNQGYPVLEVPIFAGKRHGGESTTRLGTALRLYIGACRMWSRKAR